MNSTYRVSRELRDALERLFTDPSVAYGLLGVDDFGRDVKLPDIDPHLPASDRALILKRKLEEYVLQMAAEHEEYGCTETSNALRMQVTGLLLALRDLVICFPEIRDRA